MSKVDRTRNFEVQITNKRTGEIIRTKLQMESPAGPSQARSLAESMYGGPDKTVVVFGPM